MNLQHSYPIDNGLNAFNDYDTLCATHLQDNSAEVQYCLVHKELRRKKTLTREQFMACCVNLFYAAAKDASIRET